MKEKVVLAYSGGLDTTAIIPWLKEKFDYKGFLYFTIFLFSLLTTISQGHIWGWSSKKITALVIIFAVATIMFVVRELKVSYALINFSLFKNNSMPFTPSNWQKVKVRASKKRNSSFV